MGVNRMAGTEGCTAMTLVATAPDDAMTRFQRRLAAGEIVLGGEGRDGHEAGGENRREEGARVFHGGYPV